MWARQAFILEDWQEHEIIRPLFGEVVWSPDWNRYVRRHRVAYIVIARKNGKSELAAGIVLYMLVGDDEEGAEVYGAAKDTKQAGKVAEVVVRMRQLSPVLNADVGGRLGYNKNSRRVFDEQTISYYEVITADALGELGHNPHCFVLDEVLSQRDGSLWGAMRTAAGARAQPLSVLVTTETNDPESFGAQTIDEAEKIAEDPSRSPHSFAFVRKTPREADPWDENNWPLANPALGTFLSIESLRQEALDARNDPTKENEFRQYRLNQRVQQVTRWMPIHLWDKCKGKVDEGELIGVRCFGGLDLAATTDLAALAWFFPGPPHRIAWRFWVPEAQVPVLDDFLSGRFRPWVDAGYVEATDGDIIDYDAIHAQIAEDCQTFQAARLGIDKWNSTGTQNWLAKHVPKLQVVEVSQGFQGVSAPMKELMRLVKGRVIAHGGNPVARWHADSVEAKQDVNENIRPVKPNRQKSGKRIDAIIALIMAIDCWTRAAPPPPPPAFGGPSPKRGQAAVPPNGGFRSRSRLGI
ncbi:MAG: terminase large subunit [Actinomycetota bacterium]